MYKLMNQINETCIGSFASVNLMDIRIGFSDSDEIDISSSTCCANNATTIATTPETQSPAPDVPSLRLLSGHLESAFGSPEFNCFTDAKILVATGQEVAVHRCILAARSQFFKNLFRGRKERCPKLRLSELLKDYVVGFDALVAILGYLYSGKVSLCPQGVCVCVDEDCSHIGCRPAVDFLVEVLYASSTFQVPELVTLYQNRLLDILEKVAVDDILVVLAVANICACERLLERCVEILVRSDVDFLTLDKALPQHMVKRISDARVRFGFNNLESYSFVDKHVKRIHRALDSDDVELVRMLLKEALTTLDDACALHYAVAYCDAKTTTELLDLGLADVNRRNSRGYTVLHAAAMRKEPKIIVSLLTKGARPSDLTSDGRKALQISKRLTKAVDYYKYTEEGKSCPTDRLCIEILEQAERREPLLGEASLSLAMAGDDLRMKLLYLENRVGLAKLLYPMEAKVIMDIAHLDGTCEFQLDGIASPTSYLSGKKRTSVDLNEAPFRIQEEHLTRLRALSRAVELGKRFFPRCSEVLNKIMDTDDLSQLAYVGNDTAEERLLKRTRYVELQEVLAKAFDEDKEAFDRSTISSSSSSTSMGVVRRPMVRSPSRNK